MNSEEYAVSPEHPVSPESQQPQVPPPAQAPSTAPPARAASLPDLSDLVGNGKADQRRSLRQLPPRMLVIGAAVIGAIVLAGGGFFVGHAAASTGPSTLADAVQQAQNGKLPCGTGSAAGGQFLTTICSGGGTGNRLGGRLGGNGGGAGTQNGGAQGQNGTGTGRGAAGIFGPGSVTGTVTSVSGNTMQVETRAGTITVTIAPNAEITTTTTGKTSDLAAGKTVVITADGSGTTRTASRVFILPQTN